MSSRVIMFLSPQHTWWPCGLVRMKPMSSIFQLARCCDPNRAFKGDFQKMSVMAFSSAVAQLQGLYYKSKLVKSINLHLYMKITGTISYKRHVIAVFHNSLSASEFWLRPVCWFDDLLKSLNDVFFFFLFFFFHSSSLKNHFEDEAGNHSLTCVSGDMLTADQKQHTFEWLLGDVSLLAFTILWILFGLVANCEQILPTTHNP